MPSPSSLRAPPTKQAYEDALVVDPADPGPTHKSCPFCAEPIRLEARKCKHCGESLDTAGRATERDDEPRKRRRSRDDEDDDEARPAGRPRGRKRSSHDLKVINDVIPGTHQGMLMGGEDAYHFEWMDSRGGCGSTDTAKQFILVTGERILYEASVKEAAGARVTYLRTAGSIPIAKVSYVGTVSAAGENAGCSSGSVHLLRINSGGGQIEFPFQSEAKAKRVQGVIEELIR